MIERTIEAVLKDLADKYSVVIITGPRQSGKTTLCRKVFPDMAYVNLERPDTREYAITDPRGFMVRFLIFKVSATMPASRTLPPGPG